MSKCKDEDLDSTTGLTCKSETEMQEFIDNLAISVFSITEKLDFTKYGEKPTYA